MESRFDRRELLFQPRGIPPLGTSLSLALQHLVDVYKRQHLEFADDATLMRALEGRREI